jgi:hypothetical protein
MLYNEKVFDNRPFRVKCERVCRACITMLTATLLVMDAAACHTGPARHWGASLGVFAFECYLLRMFLARSIRNCLHMASPHPYTLMHASILMLLPDRSLAFAVSGKDKQSVHPPICTRSLALVPDCLLI